MRIAVIADALGLTLPEGTVTGRARTAAAGSQVRGGPTRPHVVSDAELELVTGAGDTGETIGGLIGAAASGVIPIGSGNAANIGSAIGGKVEDVVTGVSCAIATAIRNL
jgi:hypothetical protein